MPELFCQHCGARVTLSEPIGREATCEGCGRDLHACRHCTFYDTSYNNACREPMADPVEDKGRSNFCEYFSFTRTPFRQAVAAKDRAADARAKLEALFKKPKEE